MEYLKKHPTGPYPRYTTPVGEESLTQQHFKDDVDINNVVAKAKATGLPYSSSEGTPRTPMFGDFTKPKDYQTSLDQVILAQQAFDELPAKTRKRFHGEPIEFLKFFDDPDNLEEARSLGLVDQNFGKKGTTIEEAEANAAEIAAAVKAAIKKESKSEDKSEE